MKQSTLITTLAATLLLFATEISHAQAPAARKAASFLSRVMKGGGGSVDDIARGTAKTATGGLTVRDIKIPAKLFFKSFAGKDEDTGCEFHKNKAGGLNVYTPSGDLVGVLQPNIFGGFDVYDHNGHFMQHIN